ncbi:MAG: hypothetical protein IIU58_06720, partial [Clostridia bacterium]|nr:hypothetical protein [Clostridia bacterium]
TTTIVRGKEMDRPEMQYEAITTGDLPMALYYTGSTCYTENGVTRRACPMTVEAFRAYLDKDSNPFLPEYFETVTLTSEEDGWEIAFSDPTDAYCAVFAEAMTPEIQAGSLEASGTIRLDPDGHYLSHTQEISCTLLVYQNTQADFRMNTVRRWFSHDAPVTVSSPRDPARFTAVSDLLLAELFDNAIQHHSTAFAADYEETIRFDGTFGGINCSLEQHTSPAFRLNLKDMTVRYRTEYDATATISGNETVSSHMATFENGTTTKIWDDGSRTEAHESEEVAIGGIMSNYTALTCDYILPAYLEPEYASENGICTVLVTPDFQACELIFPYIYGVLDPQNNGGIFAATDYEIRESSGKIEIDEETERITSITLFMDASFTMQDGTVWEGTAMIEQLFRFYDNDVVLPPAEGNIRRP